MKIAGGRFVVVGLGKSGKAAASLLLDRGAKVAALDTRAHFDHDVDALISKGLVCEQGPPLRALELEPDAIVVSPGVDARELAERSHERGLPLWSEIELAFRLESIERVVVAVGGTNGKSTTTELVGLMATHAEQKAFIGGNLGEPYVSAVGRPRDVDVLEVSSFQMEAVERFSPKIAILLNISDDHLDRYSGFAAYAAAKGNMFVGQSEDAFAIVPHGDAICLEQARRGPAKVLTFGPGGDVDVSPESIAHSASGLSIPREALLLEGAHNAVNVAAAAAAGIALGWPTSAIEGAARAFRGLAHRMELVANWADVAYVDDSKGTNVGASVTAVRGVRAGRVVLICGGRDKGGDYAPLADAMNERGRGVVVMGEAADRIARAMGPGLVLERASCMEEAVRKARKMAESGDCVLLSPACSSFDMFESYRARGEAFARAVRTMVEEA